MKISNIDVTLRDGGYRNGFQFELDYARDHIRQMGQSGIEWTEIGYRNGSFKPIINIGDMGMTPDSYIQLMREATQASCICVMAHPKNIDAAEIEHMRRLGVDMLRFCMDNERPEMTRNYIKLAKSLGFIVSLNLTRVSHQTLKQLIYSAELGCNAGADVIYLADSNGSMTPEQVERLVRVLHEVTNATLGFHAHDNLGLAMSNSIAAIEGGARFIDASLRGMGKGAGNLKMELWLSYLKRGMGIERYDYCLLLDQVAQLERVEAKARPVQPLDDLILGLFDLTVDDKERISFNASSISQLFANASA